jgi:hypothetical protein
MTLRDKKGRDSATTHMYTFFFSLFLKKKGGGDIPVSKDPTPGKRPNSQLNQITLNEKSKK